MRATPTTGSSHEARIDAWLETLHGLAQAHGARRTQRFTGRRSPGNHILDARIACAVEGGTDPGAASSGMGCLDAAPVHRQAVSFRTSTLD